MKQLYLTQVILLFVGFTTITFASEDPTNLRSSIYPTFPFLGKSNHADIKPRKFTLKPMRKIPIGVKPYQGDDIKWVENSSMVDCIKYNLEFDKESYTTGDLVTIKLKLDYVDQLPLSWQDEDCQKFSLKVVFPKGFVQSKGSYSDFMSIELNENQKSLELDIIGTFYEPIDNACFLVLKGPIGANSETIFIKRKEGCTNIVGENLTPVSISSSKNVLKQEDPLLFLVKSKAQIQTKHTTFPLKPNYIPENTKMNLLSAANSYIRAFAHIWEFDCGTPDCNTVTICSGENKALFYEGCNGGTVQWVNNTNQPPLEIANYGIIVAPNQTTIYTAQCLENGIVTAESSVTVTVSGNSHQIRPTITPENTEVCAGNQINVFTNGCPSGYTPVITMIWSGNIIEVPWDNIGASNSLYNPDGYTKVWAKCRDNVTLCGSEATQPTLIHIVQPGFAEPILTGTTVNPTYYNDWCVGQNLSISVNDCNGTVTWWDGTNTLPKILTVPETTTRYDYTCTHASGCTRTNYVELTGVAKYNKPEFSFYGAGVKALEASDGNYYNVFIYGCPRYNVLWDQSIEPGVALLKSLPTPAQTTTYSVKCQSIDGGCVSDVADLTLYRLNVTISATDICYGENLTLNLSGCTNGTVRWHINEFGEDVVKFGESVTFKPTSSDGANNFQTNYWAECVTPYTINFNSTQPAILSKYSSLITVNAVPQAPTISTSKVHLQPNESATLTVSGCAYNVIWSNGMNGANITVPAPVTSEILTAICQNPVGCSSNVSNSITLYRCGTVVPTLTTNKNVSTACETLTFTVSGCENAVSFNLTQKKVPTGEVLQSYYEVTPNFNIKPFEASSYSVRCNFDFAGCESQESSPITVYVSDPLTRPQITNRRSDICSGNSQTLFATGCSGTYKWYSVSNQYLGQGASFVTPLLFVPANQTEKTFQYYVKCSNGVCEVQGDIATIYVYLRPSPPTLITTPADGTICLGGEVKIQANCSEYNQSVEWSATGNVFHFGSMSQNFVSPTQTTAYTAKCSTFYGGCKSPDAIPVFIDVVQPPQKPVLATTTPVICNGESATLTATGCNGVVKWNVDNLVGENITVSPTVTTTYNAQCENQCGISGLSNNAVTIIVDVPTKPTISADKNLICLGEGGNSESITLTATGCTNGTILWSNGSVGGSITDYPSISVQYSAVCQIGGCTSEQSNVIAVTVSSIPKKPIVAVVNPSICSTDITTQATLTASGCNGTLTWSNGSNLASITVKPNVTTTYSVTCTNQCGTSVAEQKTITIVPTPPKPTLTASDVNVCVGQDVTLTAGNCSGTLIWSGGGVVGNNATVIVSPLIPTTYKVKCETLDGLCISEEESITIGTHSDPAPVLTATSNTACYNTSVTLNITNCVGNIAWSDGQITQSPSITVAITEDITYSASCAGADCPLSQTSNAVTITVKPLPTVPTISSNTPLTVCKNTSATLTAINCNGTIQWSNGQAVPSINVSLIANISYTATCTNDCGVSVASNALNFTVIDIPVPSLVPSSATICVGSSIQLIAGSCTGTLEWNGGELNGTEAIKTVSPLVTTTYQVRCKSQGCASAWNSSTITVNEITAPPIITVDNNLTTICIGGSTTLRASNCTVNNLIWSNGVAGVNSITVNPTISTSYSVRCVDVCGDKLSNSQTITVLNPQKPVVTPTTQSICEGDPVTLSTASSCENGVLAWSVNNLIGSSITFTPTATATYQVQCKMGTCLSPLSDPVTVTIIKYPVISIVSNAPVTVGKNIQLSAQGTANSFQWTLPNGTLSSGKNLNVNQATLADGGIYKITATNGGICSFTATVEVVVQDENCSCNACDQLANLQNDPQVNPNADFGNNNYVVENTYLEAYTTIPTTAKATQGVAYFDGLGRPIQKIGVKSGGNDLSSNKNYDLVSFMEYDALGRETKKYLPFAKENNNGAFINPATIIGFQKGYYQTDAGKSGDKDFAFAETEFENSPLNRVLKQGSPGATWQLNNNHTVRMTYSTNTKGAALTDPAGDITKIPAWMLHNIKQFKFVTHNADVTAQTVNVSYYLANQLFADLVQDENDNYSVEFKDKEGKLVCKRVYNSIDNGASKEDQMVETNYLYDDLGLLRFVIQPNGSALLSTQLPTESSVLTEWQPYTSTINHLTFFYEYDARGRMIRKRVPGMTAFVTMEYNLRDLLIKTTDANGKILMTEYDNLDRVTKTKLKNNATDAEKILTESFYDDYTALGTTKAFDKAHAYNQDKMTQNPRGSATVTKMAIMDAQNNIWQSKTITTVSYFDNLGRIIQTITENVQGKEEKSSSKLDFVGRVRETKTTTNYVEANANKTLEILTKTAYDNGSRVKGVCQKIGADYWEPVTRNSYTPIGELLNKKLGCDLQTVDYTYNIRSWLTKINNIDEGTQTNILKNNKDLFGMTLGYTGLYNGNISEQKWQSIKQVDVNNVSATAVQKYTYGYDALSRLLKADFVGINEGISLSMYNPQATRKEAYDQNGNILNLYRQTSVGYVDKLAYSYEPLNNRLKAVTDGQANADVRYFIDNNTGATDYGYDAAGNMTQDANKYITGIIYNHANLPIDITRDKPSTADANDGKMRYYYTASGQKVRVEVFSTPNPAANATPTKITEYLGGMVLRNGEIEFIGSAEGRVITTKSIYIQGNGTAATLPTTGNQYRYEYHLKDHLGNLRVACRCGDPKRNANNGNIQNGSEGLMVVQENHYDPWGLNFGTSTENQIPTSLNLRYQYNGKEKVQDLNIGLYEYGFRWYDQTVARFVQVDPLANDYTYKTTYDYAENTPIQAIDLDGLESVTANVNFGVSFGTNGFKIHADLASTGSYKYAGASLGFGLTYYSNFYTTSKSGIELRSSFMARFGTENRNASFGTNFWNGFGKGGLNEFQQQTGMVSATIDRFYFRYENDGAPFEMLGKGGLADLDDKYRTAAATIGWRMGEKMDRMASLNMNLLTGRRDDASFKSENKEWDGHDGTPMGYGKFGERYTHGFVHEKGPLYRFGGLTLDYAGLSVGINSDRYVRHPFQNILAHDWIKDQRQFPVYWGGVKSNIQYSTYDRNKTLFTGWGN